MIAEKQNSPELGGGTGSLADELAHWYVPSDGLIGLYTIISILREDGTNWFQCHNRFWGKEKDYVK